MCIDIYTCICTYIEIYIYICIYIYMEGDREREKERERERERQVSDERPVSVGGAGLRLKLSTFLPSGGFQTTSHLTQTRGIRSQASSLVASMSNKLVGGKLYYGSMRNLGE